MSSNVGYGRLSILPSVFVICARVARCQSVQGARKIPHRNLIETNAIIAKTTASTQNRVTTCGSDHPPK